MTNNQALLFLIFSLNGIIIGFLFDFFRILRKSFKTSNIVTYIQDIIFWIFTGITIIFFMYNFSDGCIRLFMFIGITLGFLIYILTLSKYIIKFFVFIIELLKKILTYIILIFQKPIKIVFNSIKDMIHFFYKLYHKISNFFIKKSKKNPT